MRTFLALCLTLLVAATFARADDWTALESPTAILLMRHALAPGTGDPTTVVIGDCTTQRNLDARGRDQARRTGDALRDRGITIHAVLTSQWCRCRETADLMALGPVTDLPSLNSFFGNRSEGPAQTRETLAFLDQSSGRRLLVTHQVNITALTDVFPQSGEIIATELENGTLRVTGRVLIAP